MKPYGLNELREKFLSFFESKGHLRLPSFSLIPQHDQSLLLINSGMAPMKPFFKGEQEPPRHRVCTCQKCIRTGDIENIGKTSRHGTYFEMLGNFSFGDYFKHEAIAWSWEFLTSPEWLEIDPDRLYPSVYVDDDEAFNIWRDEIGIAPERIIRLGKEDNFWEHGAGPCGPCSEIYYDRGEKYGCGKPDCAPGCDCDRYMEVWNNVFSQFDNDGNGNYSDLVQKNIDTGMGLERLAVVCQGVESLFDVDTVHARLDEALVHALIMAADQHQMVIIRPQLPRLRLTERLPLRGEVNDARFPVSGVRERGVQTAFQRLCIHHLTPAAAVGIIVHLPLAVVGVVPDLVAADVQNALRRRAAENALAQHASDRIRKQCQNVNAVIAHLTYPRSSVRSIPSPGPAPE